MTVVTNHVPECKKQPNTYTGCKWLNGSHKTEFISTASLHLRQLSSSPSGNNDIYNKLYLWKSLQMCGEDINLGNPI